MSDSKLHSSNPASEDLSVLFTDSPDVFQDNAGKNCILLNGALIIDSNFLSQQETTRINQKNNSIEIEAGELVLSELNILITKLSDANIRFNKFIDHKPADQKLYDILFSTFNKFNFKKYILKLCLKNFLSEFQDKQVSLELNFSDNYQFIKQPDFQQGLCQRLHITIRPSKSPVFSRLKLRLKNITYFFYDVLRFNRVNSKVGEKKFRFMFFLFDLPHHTSILNTFFEILIENENVHIDIIYLSFDFQVQNQNKLLSRHKDKIHIYRFKDFKNSIRFPDKELLNKLTAIDPNFSFFKFENILFSIELQYKWLENILQKLKPDVCIQLSSHDIGRIIANVTAYYKIPSIQVDYALISDHHLIESKIAFTARACMGQTTVDIWKKRKDQSNMLVPIGFCKLDNMETETELLEHKKEFFDKHQLDYSRKTIFFASTWGYETGEIYNNEKVALIVALSVFCHENNWNLIIKKHPLELDTLANEALEQNRFPKQKVFNYDELSLNQAIVFSELSISQSSSIVLEALYFNRMVCFLSDSGNRQMIMSGTVTENGVPTFNNFEIFKQYAFDILLTDKPDSNHIADLKTLKENILYKTDGKSSQRLLHLVADLCPAKKDLLIK